MNPACEKKNQEAILHKFKVVILGDSAVGKSSILSRFVYDTFSQEFDPTVGIDFISKNIIVDSKSVRLQLWDTAGRERFRSLIPSYIRDAQVAVLCFDVTSLQSFQNIRQWFDYVREERGYDVLSVLIANKIDITDDRKVTTEEAEKFAKDQELLYFEISAKEGTNIQQAFTSIIEKRLGPVIQSTETPNEEKFDQTGGKATQQTEMAEDQSQG